MTEFAGKTFVLRIDDASANENESTFFADVSILIDRHVRPIIIAPDPITARAVVRTINRSSNIAVGLNGADAALLPHTPSGIGRVQADILRTLTSAGYVPVIEPTAFTVFAHDDMRVVADDVAAAIATACEAARAIFFHQAGGVPDPDTHDVIGELTPAEALAFAEDESVPADLRAALRAAALGVRQGVPAAQILDGRVAHACVVEVFTTHHLGTQVTGGIVLAA